MLAPAARCRRTARICDAVVRQVSLQNGAGVCDGGMGLSQLLQEQGAQVVGLVTDDWITCSSVRSSW
jgi:hypothetical protein